LEKPTVLTLNKIEEGKYADLTYNLATVSGKTLINLLEYIL